MPASSAACQKTSSSRARCRLAGGELREAQRSEPEALHPLHLGDGVLGAGDGDDRVADETVGRDRAVVLGEERVVGAHHRQVRVLVGDVLDVAADEHGWVQHLGVDPVEVLLTEPLRGVAGPGDGCAVVVPVRLAEHLERPTGRDVLPVVDDRHALDDPPLAAAGEVDQTRRSIAVLGRNVAKPRVGWYLEVPITRDDGVRPRHGWSPLCSARPAIVFGATSNDRGAPAGTASTKSVCPVAGSR